MVRRLRFERSSSALQADVLTTITIGANSPVIFARFFTDGPRRAARINDPMNNRISDFLFRATPRPTMVDDIPCSRPTMQPEPIEIRMRLLYPARIPSPSSSTHSSAFSLVMHISSPKGRMPYVMTKPLFSAMVGPFGKLERISGYGPVSSHWQGDALPLSYIRVVGIP
jgi:hypothetical protein